MSPKNTIDNNPVIAALRLFFAPLVNKTSKLPAPLAYGSAVILALFVIVLLGAAIPENLIWLIGLIILACLAAFVFLDWDVRHASTKTGTRLTRKDRDNIQGTTTIYVVVHRAGDKTAYIADAEVRLSLPDPQIRHTDTNGAAIFASIPSKYIGQSFPINAAKRGYKVRTPDERVIQNDAQVYMGLEPLSESPPTEQQERADLQIDERKRRLKERANRLSQRQDQLESASYYYFYISLDKIEKLENQPTGVGDKADETIRTILAETTSETGRNEEYRSRCRRLKDTLTRALTTPHIQHLTEPPMSSEIKEGWAYAELRLKIKETKGNLLILQGKLGNFTLELSCSENNFLDYEPTIGRISYTSTNTWFFSSGQEFLFRSHFWILSLDHSRKIALGSPIYLALPVGVLSS